MARVTPLHPPPPPRGDIELDSSRILAIGKKIGRGSSATVYRAVLEGAARVRRSVAVKVFDVVATDDCDTVVPRLARAVRHAAAITHPNVAQFYEFGVLPGGPPFAMSELVEGRSLQSLLDAYMELGQRVPLDLALFIGTEVAEALLGARLATKSDGNPAGVTHGDLSPRDVLLSWHGEVKVCDFGVAAAVGGASTVRRMSSLTKRATTLAPEVAKGSKGDARSDVFSLGVILHEMLIAPRFPPGTSEAEKLTLARDGFVQLALFAPSLPSDLKAIIERAIEVDPSHRYPHAGVLAYELRRSAMALGVGDGRVFLRHALQTLGEPLDEDNATSDERPVSTKTTTRMDVMPWREKDGER